ncbi:hypothetical protein NM688_g3968 [Phlebia brevispora]|uniref:Uncharacterized protein n=1 Tax=Phlebia brevispora TaxID=194682 RepID=A0ACC1T4W4_9APHY|nr:hypothetical protein NM688_g3968 [Phlebia brevispora]
MLNKSNVLVCTFIAFNLGLAVWRTVAAGYRWRVQSRAPFVDYIDINFPVYWSLPPSDPVAMSLHEPARFSLASDNTTGDLEWMTVLNYTREGRVQFGEQQRAFMPAYFHQFHCLRSLQRSIVFPGDRGDVNLLKAPDEHVHHCLNYLRQLFICVAADSLEKGDFTQHDLDEGTVGDDLVCQDWEVLFGEMERKYEEFAAWSIKYN